MVTFNERSFGIPLFLIHNGLGVSTKSYQNLAEQLKYQHICVINNPRFGMAGAFGSIEEMAAEYIIMMKSRVRNYIV